MHIVRFACQVTRWSQVAVPGSSARAVGSCRRHSAAVYIIPVHPSLTQRLADPAIIPNVTTCIRLLQRFDATLIWGHDRHGFLSA